MSRLEWILGLVLLALLIVVVGLAASLWLNPSRSVAPSLSSEAALVAASANQVEPMRTTAVQTAKNDYLLAYAATRNWQGDAALINATATWPQGAKASDLTPGKEAWSFIFYTPSARTTAVVSVADGAASLSPRDTPREIQPLDITGWQMDSSDATEIFLANGGEAFIGSEGITIYSMTLLLNDPNNNNRAEWLMSLLAPGNGRSLTMRLDASSGEIIETIDSSSS
jgi:hypothetical protein